MAYNFSAAAKQAMMDEMPQVAKATIYLADKTQIEVTESDLTDDGFYYSTQVLSGKKFGPGAVCASSVRLRILNLDHKFDNVDFLGAEFVPYVGVLLDEDTVEFRQPKEWLQLTRYTIIEPIDTNSEIIELLGYDNIYKLTQSYDGGFSFPGTAKNLAQYCCDSSNVVLNTPNFDHEDYVIPRDVVLDTTYQQILGYIAGLTCHYVVCNRYGQIEFRWFPEDVTHTLSARKIETLTPQLSDITITGVRVKAAGTMFDYGETWLVGKEGYVIELSNNPLVTEGNAHTVADFLAEKLNGMKFRPLSANIYPDLSWEIGDRFEIAENAHPKGPFISLLTNYSYTINDFAKIECKAESTAVARLKTFSQNISADIRMREFVERKTTTVRQATEEMNKLAANTMGFYYTSEQQEDGSTIAYWHDKPKKEDSTIIYKQGIDGFFLSRDGGKTYQYGRDSQGNEIVNILAAVGISAEWVDVYGKLLVRNKNGDVTFYVDEDGNVQIKSTALEKKFDDLQDQIDGNIQTWTGSHVPALNNYPANEWGTEEEKNNHLGDMYYVDEKGENSGAAYRFQRDNQGNYYWQLLKDSDITKAIGDAAEAKKAADNLADNLDKNYSTTKEMQAAIDVAAGNIKSTVTEVVKGEVKSKTTIYYGISTSATNPPSSWDTNMPTKKVGEYLWRKDKLTYGDGTEEWLPAYVASGSDGLNGQDGTGVSITSQSITYQASDNGTTTPTGTWSTSIPTVKAGQYLWTKTVVNYSDGKSTTAYSVAYKGTDGATGAAGRGIKSEAITYQASSSGTTAPTGTWSTSIPTVPAGQYLWTRTVYTYTDNTTSTSYSVSKIGQDGAQGTQGINLVLDSGVVYANTAYQIHVYTLSEDFELNTDYTITIWGELGDGKTRFSVYVGDGNAGVSVYKLRDNVYKATWKKGSWYSEGQASKPRMLLVYTYPSSVTGVKSTINRIKLEKGIVEDPVWTPAPQDLIGPAGKNATQGINLLSSNKDNWIHKTLNSDTGEESESSTRLLYRKLYIKAGEVYTVSKFQTESQYTYQVLIFFYEQDGTYCGRSVSITAWERTFPFIVTAPLNAAYCNFLIRHSDNSFIALEELDDQIRIKFEIGDVENPVWTPSPQDLVGPAGTSVTGSTITYQASSSGTTPPTGKWETTPPTVSAGQFLWTKIVFAKSDGTSSEPMYSVSRSGDNGAKGTSITSWTPEYYLSTSNTLQTGGSWVKTPPAYVSGRFYWTRATITWSDGTTSTTTAVLDNGLTDANRNALEAKDTVDNMEIGGRNLLRFTGDMPLSSDLSTGIRTINNTYPALLQNTDDGVKLTFNSSNNACFEIPLVYDGAVENNETVTLSFDYRGNITKLGQFFFMQRQSPNSAITTGIPELEVSTADWKHYSWTFSHYNANVRTCYSILLFYANSSYNTSNWVEIKKGSLKLEKGNMETDWTPAPEDTDQKIVDAVDGIEVGGRNLLLGSGTPRTLTSGETNTSTYGTLSTFAVECLTKGTYSFSAKLDILSGSPTRCTIRLRDKDRNNVETIHMDIIDGRIQTTFDVGDVPVYYIYFYNGYAGQTNGNEITFSEMMLERGNKATDWTPAPEDVTDSIESVRNEVHTSKAEILQEASQVTIEALENYVSTDRLSEFEKEILARLQVQSDNITASFEGAQKYTIEVDGRLQEFLDEFATYIRMSKAGIELGDKNSPFGAMLGTTRLSFVQDGREIAYISNNTLYITDAHITGSLTRANHIRSAMDGNNVYAYRWVD